MSLPNNYTIEHKASTRKTNRKLEKKLLQREALTTNATSIASAVKTASKKNAKKGGKGAGFWNILAGAARMAGELAPVLAPLIFAKHGPSQALAQASGATAVGAPVASPVSCAACTGLYGMKPTNGKDGRVQKVVVRGMDYLGTVSVNSDVQGTLLQTVSMNPFDPAWAGTMLQRQASMFERYRPRRVACLVEPSCPATTMGQLLCFIDPDPDDEFTYAGRQAVQIASSHEGADISQVWGMNVSSYAFDQRTQDFYADADGSDERLLSPGTWRILAGSDMPASTVVGTMYCVWEYEFLIPQLELLSVTGGNYLFGRSTWLNGQQATPWIGGISTDLGFGSTLFPEFAQNGPEGAISYMYGIPPGNYFLLTMLELGNFTAITLTVDGANFKPIAYPGSMSPIEEGGGGTPLMGLYGFSVASRSENVSEGYLTITTTVTSGGVGSLDVLLVSYNRSITPSRRFKSLQAFEDEVVRQSSEIQALRAAMSASGPVTLSPLTSIPVDALASVRHRLRR